MKNHDSRIERLERETPLSGQNNSLEMIRKWRKETEERFGKIIITPEQRKRWEPLLKYSNSMSKAK